MTGIPKHGYAFRMEVSSVETKLPEPYNKCKERPYNQMHCIEKCVYKWMERKYNCTLPETLFTIQGAKECKESALDRAESSYTRNEYFDECKGECPLEDCHSKKLSHEYLDDSSLFENEMTSTWIKDLIVLSFYLRDFSYLNITQIPKTDVFTFINNIGGGLGLFMGLAFPNFVEFFQFIVDILAIAIFN